MLSAGQVVDRYRVEAEVGRGACAVVYRVRHTKLDSVHALKLLQEAPTALQQRLVQEGRIQATLRHPNVVAVTDIVEHDGVPGLIVEYIEGPSLEQWLRGHRPTQDEAEALFREILSGLTSAHDQGVIHRDLKPSNVLLQPVDGRLVPRITDFGIAKLMSGDPAPSLTYTATSMGSPRYMAPEQWRDSKAVDVRADLFSLGCILYELLTGEHALAGDSLPDIFLAASTRGYRDPIELCPDMPPHLQAAIAGCLEPDPARRLPDGAAVLDVLEGRLGFALPATGEYRAQGGSWPTLSPQPETLVPLPPSIGNARRARGAETFTLPADTASSLGASSGGASLGSTRPVLGSGPGETVVPGGVPGGLPGAEPTLLPGHTLPPTQLPSPDAPWRRWVPLAAGGAAMLVAAWLLWPPPPAPATPAVPPPAVELPAPAGSAVVPSPAPEAGVVAPAPTPDPAPTPATSPGGTAIPAEDAIESGKPAADEPDVGTVRVTGNAEQVWLLGAGEQRYRPGKVPSGRYKVMARFPGEDKDIHAADVSVRAGGSVTLECKTPFNQCKVK